MCGGYEFCLMNALLSDGGDRIRRLAGTMRCRKTISAKPDSHVLLQDQGQGTLQVLNGFHPLPKYTGHHLFHYDDRPN